MSSNNNYSGGIGFFGLLTIVFIVLKLTNVIAWSWWWVLAPMMPFVLTMLILFAVLVIGLIKLRKR